MTRICNWFEARSRWSKLRNLGQSSLVRASVLMPVLGHLLLLNEHVHQFLTIQHDADWPFNSLHPMWRVWMLYYGSAILAAGSMLFAWQCPAVIKDYASDYKMVEAERDHLVAHNLTGQIAKDLQTLYQGMSAWENALFTLPRLKPDQPNLGAGTAPELTTSDQWGLGLIHIWTANDIKHPQLRIVSFFLFGTGLVLLAIPAIFTFLQVTLLLVKHIAASV